MKFIATFDIEVEAKDIETAKYYAGMHYGFLKMNQVENVSKPRVAPKGVAIPTPHTNIGEAPEYPDMPLGGFKYFDLLEYTKWLGSAEIKRCGNKWEDEDTGITYTDDELVEYYFKNR